MLKKITVTALLVATTNINLFANSNNSSDYIKECPLDYRLMYSIAKTEGHYKRDVGYPYIICFNKGEDVEKFKSINKFKNIEWLDKRSLDCKNSKQCNEVLNLAVSNNIKNIDIGPFQFNYRHHVNRFKNVDFFSLKSSYLKACDFLVELINKYGYSWETIGKYHSHTNKHNERYYTKLYNEIYNTGENN